MPRPVLLRFVVILLVSCAPLALGAILAPPSALPEEQARQTAGELDRLLQMRMQEVFTFAAFPSIRGFAASTPSSRSQRASVALNELQAWVAADKLVREAFIVDSTGTSIMTTSDDWGADWSGRTFVRQALGGQLSASGIVRDRGEFSQYYAAPVLDNSGEVAGVLAARVAAQELWAALPAGAGWYAVLVDENGVRLGDSGMPSQNLVSLGPLDPARSAQLLGERAYGTDVKELRHTEFVRAQELAAQQALDQVGAGDLGVERIAVRTLETRPWTVVVVAESESLQSLFGRLAIPALAAVLLSLAGAVLLAR